MIDQKKAKDIAQQYLKSKKRRYTEIDRVSFKEDQLMTFGKYTGQNRPVFLVGYLTGSTAYDPAYVIYVDAENGDVHFTLGPHGALERYEK
jgi:hypothetical protein